MKKQLLSVSILLCGALSIAQNAIVNGGFENWTTVTYKEPSAGWLGSSNREVFQNGLLTPNATQVKSPNSNTGAYAIKLETISGINGDTLAAYFFNGDPSSGQGGIPVSGTPATLTGYYKGSIMPGDTALVLVMLKQGGQVISFDLLKLTGSTSNYTQFTLPLNAIPMSVADSVIIAGASSNALNGKGVIGSMIYFDSFTFTGIAQQPADLNGDFELWDDKTHTVLNDWFLTVEENNNPKSTDAHNGASALKLIVIYDAEANNNQGAYFGEGVANGTWSANSNDYTGKPFTTAKDTLVGWYKYAPQGVDSARGTLFLKKNGVNIVYKEWFFTANNSYTQFEVPFDAGMNTPDTMAIQIWASSGNTDATNLGSELILDDIYFKSQLPVISSSASDITCNGDNDGVIDITVSGGTAPYQFAWSNGSSTEDLSSLAPGTYTVTVTDNIGTQAVYNATVSEPTILSYSVTVQDANCGSSNGDATVNVMGGTSPYTYSWSNSSTDALASGLSAGIYQFLVTDNNGCTVEDAAVVGNVNGPSVSVANQTGNNCYGETNGSILATATNGTPNYTYSWSDGQTTALASGLAAGGYTVEVIDANGCQAFASEVITQPAQLAITTTLQFNPSCYGWNDGQIGVATTGGTQIANPPYYNYLFSNGETADVAVNLYAGTHTITVTDANGCMDSITVTLGEPNPLVGSVDSIFHVTTCSYDNTGRVYLSATGGNGNYSYYWPNTMTYGDSSDSLAAGTYDVIVNDPPYGCIDTVTFTITGPTPLSLTTTLQFDPACYGGSDGQIGVTTTGGTPIINPPYYNYLFSNGVTTDAAVNLTAGTHTITVTDSLGCMDSITVTLGEPSELVATAGSVNDSAYVDAVGGTGAYSYSWSQGGVTTNYATGLSNGTYTITVIDANGCIDSDSTTIVITGFSSIASNNVSVYPNPTNGLFFINSDIASTTPVVITIRNVIGQVVYNRTESQLPKLYKVNVGSTLPSGLYTIELQSGDNKYMTRIVFE